MAPAVRQHPMEATSMQAYPAPITDKHLSSEWIFTRNRSLGPIVIGMLLVMFYFVSPYLPQAFRNFLATLH